MSDSQDCVSEVVSARISNASQTGLCCSNCDTENPPRKKFCGECGADHLVIFNERFYAASCLPISTTTNAPAPVFRSIRIASTLGRFSIAASEESLPSQRLWLASSLRTSRRLIRLGLKLTNRCAGSRTASSEDLFIGGLRSRSRVSRCGSDRSPSHLKAFV
jgi:hypothetical protein